MRIRFAGTSFARRRFFAAGLFAFVSGLSSSSFAASAGLDKSERMRELTPVYVRVRADTALLGRFLPKTASRAEKAALMKAWPMSPEEYLEIDMHTRRFEVAISSWLHGLHEVWLTVHPEEGRRLYGDAAVDLALTGYALGEDTGPVPDSSAPTPPSGTAVGPNRNAAETDAPAPEEYQGEIQLAVNPNNPQQIVAAANTWDPMGGTCGDFGMQAVWYTGNGGVTWDYTCAPSEAAFGMVCGLSGTFGSDPAVAWDDQGNVFIEYILLCTNGAGLQFAIVVAKSANGGATWTAQGIVKDSWALGTIEDKNFYAIDVYPTSPYYGRHYTCWDRDSNERFAYSTNGGAIWTEVNLPTPALGDSDLGCDLAVEDNGHIHVAFNRRTCSLGCEQERAWHTRSTNGGATWSTPVQIHQYNMVGYADPPQNRPPVQDNRGVFGFGAIDVDNSGGPCRGRLYYTYNDFPGGGSVAGLDVWVRSSTDDGATWSAGVKVNDDNPTTDNVQYNSFLVVDQAIRQPVVIWQDTRNDASGDQEYDLYASRSANCGATWETNLKISAASAEFNNNAISFSNENTAQNALRNPNQTGEYLGLDVYGGRVYAAWCDSRHFFPASTGESQKENLGFVEVKYGELFFAGHETGDLREYSATVP